MTLLDTLITLSSGARPQSGLLHTCRLAGRGAEIYGIEAIAEHCRRAPFALTQGARLVQHGGHVAAFDGERAIVADLLDGNIARLWLLDPDGIAGGAPVGEPGLDVPFDPDLDQSGGDVFFAASDHPALAPGAAPLVEMLGRSIATEADGQRTRAFAIRAFGTAAAGAALFSVFRLRPRQQDVAGFTLAAAHWQGSATRFVRDRGGEAALASRRWSPRVEPTAAGCPENQTMKDDA